MFLLTLSFEYIQRLRAGQQWQNALKLLLPMALAFGIIYLPYFLWRWQYFGYFFPNTYYAKTGAGFVQIKEGISYLSESLNTTFSYSLVGLCLGLMVFAPCSKDQSINLKAGYLLAVTLGVWGMTVANGGDHFSLGRFIVPSLPLLGLLMVLGIRNLYDCYKTATIVLLCLAFTSLGLHHLKHHAYAVDVIRSARYILENAYQNYNHQKTEAFPHEEYSRYSPCPPDVCGFVVMGKALRKTLLPGESIAVVPIGAIGYYSEAKVIDMVGLVDVVIAHEPFDPVYTATWRPGHDKGNGEYILSLQPTYIQLMDQLTHQPRAEPNDHMLQYKSVVEIWNSERFHEEYDFYPIQVENGWYYNPYKRKK